jgi:hypothetical protein
VLRKALGITQADIDHMRRFADELDKMAEAEREAGNQAAAAAGNIAKAKNSTDDFGRSTKGATKEANELKKAMFEIHLTTAKLAKEVNEDFFAENLRVATIRTQQEMALFQQGLEKEHPLGRQIGSSLSGGLGTFDDKVEKSAKNFQAKFQAAIQAVGVAMQILGVKTESTFAKTFQGAASGALSGAAVGSFFPGAGTAIGGVVGGVLGGVTSFIRARREAEQRALEERAKAEADAVAKLKGLWAEYEAFRKDLAEKGIKGLGDAFAYFLKQGDLSAENLKQLGSVGLATFAALRKAGYSILDAFKMMGPALEEALKAGMSEDGPFGWLVALYRRAQDNEGAVKAIEGLAASFDFLRSTMHITQQQLDEFMGLFATAFTDLIGGAERGTAAYNEGLVLSAGLLFRLWKAAKDYGLALDENTQKMVDDAEAMGLFEDMKDPLDALVEIMNNMLLVLVAIAKVFKVTLPAAVQEYIDKILAIPKIPTPPGMPAPPPDEPPPDTQLAAGAIDRFFPARPGGHLVNVAERGMGEYLTVTHAPLSVRRDATASSRTAGPITVNINGYNRDPRELAREVAAAVSGNVEGAGTAVRIAATGRP